MSALYRHRIYCNTENAWAYLWKEDQVLLTACPNNAAHTIQDGSAGIIDERSDGTVIINKEAGFGTKGRVRVDSVVINAAAGSSGSTTAVWPIDIAIYTLRAAVTADCVGCSITAEASPLTTAGTLTADAPIGTTVLNVSPTVAANTDPGLVVTLQMGATVQELGRATAIDTALNTVTVEAATTSNFLAAGPTLVKLTSRAADNMELPLAGYLTFGEDRSKAVGYPKGRTLVFTLTNPNPSPARLVVYISYNY